MGNKTSKANKEFQAVIPYTPSSRPNPKRKKQTQPRRPTVAPALLAKEKSGVSVDSNEQEAPVISAQNPRRVPLRSPSLAEDVGWSAPKSAHFDFSNTEGQNRRELIASCEDECSLITDFLYVGGFKVANSKAILMENKITRIINCSLCAVDNVFEHDEQFTYLSLNMLDGRQDDISWFVCEVINFIEIARRDKCNVLLHCERGISRSCSFAIAYVMWASGCQWKLAFDYVRERRQSCSPNTGFTCNLIEIDELFYGDSRYAPLMFRLAQHLPHDQETPILKLIRNADSRNIIRPHFSFLNSDGIFVIRPSKGLDSTSVVYIWRGRNTGEVALKAAISLVEMMSGVFGDASNVEIVLEGSEGDDFKDNVEPDTDHTVVDYDDLYIPLAETVERQFAVANSTSTTGWMSEFQNKIPTRLHIEEVIRGTFLQGADQFKTDPTMILTTVSTFPSSPSKSKLKLPEFKMNTAKVTPTSTPTKIPSSTSTAGKQDEISSPTSVSIPLSTLGTSTSGNSNDDNRLVLNGNNDHSNEHEQKDETFDMSILTPLNPIKDKVVVVDLQLPSDQTTDQNPTESPGALITVATPKKTISRIKPVLFQCFSSSDNVLSWQHMGIYDDDDLQEDLLLLLLCPKAPHHLWKGSVYEMSQLAVVNSVSKFEEVDEEDNSKDNDKRKSKADEEDVNDDEKTGTKTILQFAKKVVDVGEVPLSSEELQTILSSGDNVHVHLQNSESELWWDAFNTGM